jgi:hypothetical protein
MKTRIKRSHRRPSQHRKEKRPSVRIERKIRWQIANTIGEDEQSCSHFSNWRCSFYVDFVRVGVSQSVYDGMLILNIIFRPTLLSLWFFATLRKEIFRLHMISHCNVVMARKVTPLASSIFILCVGNYMCDLQMSFQSCQRLLFFLWLLGRNGILCDLISTNARYTCVIAKPDASLRCFGETRWGWTQPSLFIC